MHKKLCPEHPTTQNAIGWFQTIRAANKPSFPIPKELESYVQGQIQSGTYNNVAGYFLTLLNQDRQRRTAQAKLASLLQEGLDSDAELVTSAYWQNLRLSVLGTEH